MRLKNPRAKTYRRRVSSRTKHSAKTTSTKVSTPPRRSLEAPRVKILTRIGVLMRRLRMALVTCSKKQPARTCPRRSPTKTSLTFKERMHRLDDKWNKCRPYLERINGTIVPLRSSSFEDHGYVNQRAFGQQRMQQQPITTAH